MCLNLITLFFYMLIFLLNVKSKAHVLGCVVPFHGRGGGGGVPGAGVFCIIKSLRSFWFWVLYGYSFILLFVYLDLINVVFVSEKWSTVQPCTLAASSQKRIKFQSGEKNGCQVCNALLVIWLYVPDTRVVVRPAVFMNFYIPSWKSKPEFDSRVFDYVTEG